jgi:hypothetical protein
MARRIGTGNTTYIGSWLTIVAIGPDDGPTTLPGLTKAALILPSMGERISV